MKTNNLTKKSFLTSMILIATALFSSKHSGQIKDTSGSHTGGRYWILKGYSFPGEPNSRVI
jgi:hypothetical protein